MTKVAPRQISLLPLTPNTFVGFKQEILVDTAAMLEKSVKRELALKLPKLTQEGQEMSYMAAFEALRLFREMTRKNTTPYSELEQTQLAEVEVEWCLDILGRLHRAGKLED